MTRKKIIDHLRRRRVHKLCSFCCSNAGRRLHFTCFGMSPLLVKTYHVSNVGAHRQPLKRDAARGNELNSVNFIYIAPDHNNSRLKAILLYI